MVFWNRCCIRRHMVYLQLPKHWVWMILLCAVLILSYPHIVKAQTGNISGKIWTYAYPHSVLQGITVTAFDEMVQEMGSTSTLSDGSYTIQNVCCHSHQ